MSTLLRTTLFLNATFSAACGSLLVVGADRLEPALGLSGILMAAGGTALIGFAAAVGLVAAREWLPGAGLVFLADLAWVIGAAVVLVGFRDVLTGSGAWALAIVSLVVLDLAVVEGFGLTRRTA